MSETPSQSRVKPAPDSLASRGYRLAAEWEPHAATWLSWPHNRDTWPGAFEPIPEVFARFARSLAEQEPVNICAGSDAVLRDAERHVGSVPNITLHDIRTNDCWIRDHGPIFLSGPADAPPMLLDFQYNAWGGKYPPFDDDNRVPGQVAEITGYERVALDMILEGGAIDVNGRGTLLTTEECLLNPNRNPGMTRDEIEQMLADHLGATNILWLCRGIVGDDTDGHIDQLARFVAPHHVVTIIERDPGEANHLSLAENLARLYELTDEAGRQLEVTTLDLPRPKYFGDQRLPCSYANFCIANNLVVVPTFDDPADDAALGKLRELFPGRKVIGQRAVDLVWGLGAFHCASKEQGDVTVSGV